MPAKINIEHLKEEILKLNDQKMSPRAIGELFGLKHDLIRVNLRKWGQYRKYESLDKFSAEEIEFIKQNYGKILNKDLNEILHTDNTTLTRYVKRAGLELKKSGTLIVNTNNPFLEKSNESEYWLGYLAGDGHIDKYNYGVKITTTDYEIVEKFKLFLEKSNYNVPIFSRQYQIKNGDYHTIYNVGVSSRWIHRYLTSIGFTCDKSRTLDLNVEFTGSFLRGLFDADGWVHSQYNSAKFTSASQTVVDKLRETLSLNGIETSVTFKGNAQDVYFHNPEKILKFYKLLYQDAEVFLTRKHNRFVNLLEKYNKDNIVNLIGTPIHKNIGITKI